MKKLLPILTLVLIPALGMGQGGIYKDKNGDYAGSWEGGEYRRIYKDKSGGYLGSAEKSGEGWIFKDKSGGYIGSSSGDSDRFPYLNDDN